MSGDRKRRHPIKDDPAGIGGRAGDCPVIVVGVGASAGALKSLKRLFAGMPLGHGVAFVLIEHQEPSRGDLSIEQLKDLTALAVAEAEDGIPVLADRIHVIPADKFLNITGSRLTLQEPVTCNGLRMPIDHFFCSLARDQGHRACGILFNGEGSDGTLGLSEIKSAGGKTLREEPGGAGPYNMPQSEVDAVLPAEAMAEAIVALAGQVRAETRDEPAESPEFNADLRAVLEVLRAKVGHDFRCYKPNTLVRRIRRRMTLSKVPTYAEYVRFLEENPDEVALLQKDLFIGVTEFFRQPKAWEVLEEKVIAGLVGNAPPESEIRVWVPGCSTGKEVFSLVMLFMEQVERSGKKVGIRIFATDSDAAALATARSGRYSEEDLEPNVSSDRRKRFFEYLDGRYQVVKEIRDKIVFAPRNLTTDPPFSNLDLISCRNLLIYLDQEVQKKIIALFHFALREGGFLFLGTAETVGERKELFEPISKRWRIYRRIGVGRRVVVEIPVHPTCAIPSAQAKPSTSAPPSRMSLASVAQQVLLEQFSPACVMIDRKLQVLYVQGAVEDYLTFPAGELTTQVVDMAREGLRGRLRGAINQCLEVNKSVTATARVKRGRKSVPVKATVSPVRYPREVDGLLLITFEDYRVSTPKSRRQSKEEGPVRQLEDELKITREELQSTIEQLETSNEQLKAFNEEVTAGNEELQSANEEVIGRPLTLLLPEDRQVEEENILRRLGAGERVEHFETVRLAKDGRRIDVSVTVSPVKDRDGRIIAASKIIRDVADQKQAEEALLESREDLNRAQAVAHTGSWRLDVRRNELRWSDETYRIFDIPKGTPLTYEAFLAAVHPEDREYVDRKWKEALLGEPYEIEHRIVVGKSVKWVRQKAELEFDREGGVQGGFGTVQDITERKKAAELVRNTALFPEENPHPVLRVAEDGNLLYSNRAAAGLLDLWRCRVGAPVPQTVQEIIAGALATETQREMSVHCGGRDLSFVLVPMVDRGYVNFYGRDVTEHKTAEEALRRSEMRFRLLSETAGRLLATDDPEGIVNELCRQVMEHLDCQAFFNFLVDERVGRLHLNACAGIPGEEARKIEWLDYGVAVCGCAALECRRIVAEDIFRTPDVRTDLVKSYGIQAYACHPLMVQDRLIGTLSFGTKTRTCFSREDLALMKTVADQVAIAMERRRLMGELRKSRDEMEIRVQERTAELEKMNEEQKIYTTMLEQSNRDLEDFAHVASHDLQEPLRKIHTFGDLLTEMHRESLDEEGRDYLKRMQRAAGRMQALVLDLLRYARVNSKAEPFTRFNLRGAVEEAIADLGVLREEMEGRIEVGELPDLEADQVQMRQLFQNLIGNALKYRSARNPVIRVHSNSSSSGPLWEIHVEDNGIGFDESYLSNIFKPFQRLHGKDSPYEGTGMGLAICRRIVERHRGSITARSTPGKGSTFIVKLPKRQVRLEKTH
jgi:chemotaxis methyl-accepting protein methylase/signal transduction histidine kinase